MRQEAKDTLNELRQRIPVGIKRGLEVLAETNGDIQQAETILKADFIQIVMHKAAVAQDVAEIHLSKVGFNIASALQRIEQEQFSLTERILRKYKKKEEALNKIAVAIEETEQLERTFWVKADTIRHLNSSLRCFLIVNEWLGYEGWENFESALYFQLAETIEQIEQQLLLPDVAQILNTAYAIHQSQLASQQKKFEKQGWLQQTPEFRAISTLFEQQKSQLVDTLYGYVQERITDFP